MAHAPPHIMNTYPQNDDNHPTELITDIYGHDESGLRWSVYEIIALAVTPFVYIVYLFITIKKKIT